MAEPVRWVVVERSGPTEPDIVAPFEVMPGTSIKLGRGASLAFSDYVYQCRTLTIVDGAINFAKQGWEISSGGRITNEDKFRCPRRYSLRDRRDPERGLMTPDRGRSTISRRPLFLFTGALADKVESAQLKAEASAIPLRVQGRQARPADEAAALAAGSAWQLSVRVSAADTEFWPLVLHVQGDPHPQAVDRVTVITLDEYKRP